MKTKILFSIAIVALVSMSAISSAQAESTTCSSSGRYCWIDFEELSSTDYLRTTAYTSYVWVSVKDGSVYFDCFVTSSQANYEAIRQASIAAQQGYAHAVGQVKVDWSPDFTCTGMLVRNF
jgi:hypothetical protein